MAATLDTYGKLRFHIKSKFSAGFWSRKPFLLKIPWSEEIGLETLHVIFVPILKQLDHLFFQCSITKVVWGIFGICLGANNTPHEVGHYRAWVNFWLPGAGVHTLCFAAICWAIWKSRNKVCFDKKTDQESTWNCDSCLCFNWILGRFVPRNFKVNLRRE